MTTAIKTQRPPIQLDTDNAQAEFNKFHQFLGKNTWSVIGSISSLTLGNRTELYPLFRLSDESPDAIVLFNDVEITRAIICIDTHRISIEAPRQERIDGHPIITYGENQVTIRFQENWNTTVELIFTRFTLNE